MALSKKELNIRLKSIDNLRTKLKSAEKSAAKDIMEMLKTLMKSNPQLLGLRWNQYTPHFADGDVCEFSVNGPEFKFVDAVNPQENKDENDEDYYDESWVDSNDIDKEWFDKKTDILNHKEISALKKTTKEVYRTFEKLMIMESELQDMFGDGYQITVTPN